MSDHDPLVELAKEVGVATTYTGQMGDQREVPPATLRAVLAAMGLGAATGPEAAERLAAVRAREAERALPDWQVVEAGQPSSLPLGAGASRWRVHLEDGGEISGNAGDPLPALPVGYHHAVAGGDAGLLLAVPPRPQVPERDWGDHPAALRACGRPSEAASATMPTSAAPRWRWGGRARASSG